MKKPMTINRTCQDGGKQKQQQITPRSVKRRRCNSSLALLLIISALLLSKDHIFAPFMCEAFSYSPSHLASSTNAIPATSYKMDSISATKSWSPTRTKKMFRSTSRANIMNMRLSVRPSSLRKSFKTRQKIKASKLYFRQRSFLPSSLASASSSTNSKKVNKRTKIQKILFPSKILSATSSSKANITPSIIAILLSTSLNLLGFTMTSPLSPNLGTHFQLNLNTAKFGSLTSAYPLGMLLGLFLWPRLSDLSMIGRKNVMVWSLFGSALGLMMQAFGIWWGWSLRVFLAMRVFTGCFAGSGPVAKAFLADVVLQEQQEERREQERVDKGVLFVADKEVEEEELIMNKSDRTMNDICNQVEKDQIQQKREDSSSDQPSSTSTKIKQESRLSQYLAWRDASSTLAYIAGPALGGTIFEFFRSHSNWFLLSNGTRSRSAISGALAFVIGLSALASLVASFLVSQLVEDKGVAVAEDEEDDTVQKEQNDKEDGTIPTLAKDKDYEIIACPLGVKLWTGIATVCAVSFLYHIADSTFFAFFPALLKNNLHLDAREIGMVFTALACVSFGVSASSLSSRSITRLGVVNTCAMGLGSIGLGLMILALSGGGTVGMIAVYSAAFLYFSGVPLYGPTVPTMLLQCVPPHQRGTVMGVDGAVNTMARVVTPLIMGDLYRRKGSRIVFGAASAAVFSSAVLALFRRFLVLREQKRPSM